MKNEYLDVAGTLTFIGMFIALFSVFVSSATGLIVAIAFSVAGIISFIIGVCHHDQ